MDKERVTSDLLASISGVLIFISLAHYIDLNGYTNFAPLILATGILILFWPRPFLKALSPLGFISKPLLYTLSHVLVFIGSKVYFDKWINNYWVIYLIVGVIFLNNNRQIAKWVIGEKR